LSLFFLADTAAGSAGENSHQRARGTKTSRVTACVHSRPEQALKQLPFDPEKSGELIQRFPRFCRIPATVENPFSASSCSGPSLFLAPRRSGEEVVSQDNELRRNERWTRGEDPISRLLHKGALRSRLVGRTIYLIVGNLHNGELACHECGKHPSHAAAPNSRNYHPAYPPLRRLGMKNS